MLNLQQIKDTFYIALRDRIALGNPARTITVRATSRPSVFVSENEISANAIDNVPFTDTFLLEWLDLSLDTSYASSLASFTCQLRYASDGSTGASGLDRGRALAAMDSELATALVTAPMHAPALLFAEIAGGGSSSSSPTGSNIFWSDPRFAAVKVRGERLERTAHVEVFGYAQ